MGANLRATLALALLVVASAALLAGAAARPPGALDLPGLACALCHSGP